MFFLRNWFINKTLADFVLDKVYFKLSLKYLNNQLFDSFRKHSPQKAKPGI
jgi:hypothetical protein